MENYVVRIYKREFSAENSTETIWGIVEEPSTNLRWRFESSEELSDIICSAPDTSNANAVEGSSEIYKR